MCGTSCEVKTGCTNCWCATCCLGSLLFSRRLLLSRVATEGVSHPKSTTISSSKSNWALSPRRSLLVLYLSTSWIALWSYGTCVCRSWDNCWRPVVVSDNCWHRSCSSSQVSAPLAAWLERRWGSNPDQSIQPRINAIDLFSVDQ